MFTKPQPPRIPFHKGWQEEEPLQTDLFDQSKESEKDDRLLETLDRVADRFGKEKLQLGIRSNSDKHKLR